jgi:HEAT repeat protein
MTIRKYLLLILLVGYAVWFVSSCTSLQNINNPESSSTPTLNDLIDGFSSSDVNDRANAAYQAGFYQNHQDKEMLIPYLVIALQEPDCGWDCSRVRAAAAQSIRYLQIYNDQAIEILITWLTESGHSDDELVQSIQTIGFFAKYASDATPGLIHIMTETPSSSPQYYQIRTAAADSVSRIGDPAAVPYLLSMLLLPSEPNWVQKNMAISLARYGSDAICTVPYLIPLLDSDIQERRIGAAIIINQATGNNFPNGNPENWDPYRLGPWKFEQQTDGEYVIVVAAKDWWKNEGVFEDWPNCNKGLDGESVLP